MTDPTTPVRDPLPGTVEQALQPGREYLTEQLRRVVKPFAADYAYNIAEAVLPILDAAVAAAVRCALEEAADALRMDWGGPEQDEGVDAAREQLRARAAVVAFPARQQGEDAAR